jgi:K+ transporter
LRETFTGRHHELVVFAANILRVLSCWALITFVSVKYVLFLRADNDGEGGILALTRCCRRHPGGRRTVQ